MLRFENKQLKECRDAEEEQISKTALRNLVLSSSLLLRHNQDDGVSLIVELTCSSWVKEPNAQC